MKRIVVLAAVWAAGQLPPPGVAGGEAEDVAFRAALLSRVRSTMRLALARMPNYTCTETIARSTGNGMPFQVDTLERLRLQVALIGGRELFSWPGAAPFERADPSDIVGAGLIGTGDFSGFTRAIFGSDAAVFTGGTEEVRADRQTIRYGYVVSRQRSTYTLESPLARAVVGYHGSIWVDPITERVLALEVHVADDVEEMPEPLDMTDVETVLEYRPMRIADAEFPFPASSTLTVVHRWGCSDVTTSIEYKPVELDGVEIRFPGDSGTVMHRPSCRVTSNRVDFSECRQYTAESSISFGGNGDDRDAAASMPAPRELPEGVVFRVALDESIGALSSAAGDAVWATLREPVKAGTIKIPRGARLRGRILRVESDLNKGTTHVRLGFSHLESGDNRFPFRARFAGFEPIPGVTGGVPGRWRSFNLRDLRNENAPEWGTRMDFTLSGKESRIPAGFRMKWVTVLGR